MEVKDISNIDQMSMGQYCTWTNIITRWSLFRLFFFLNSKRWKDVRSQILISKGIRMSGCRNVSCHGSSGSENDGKLICLPVIRDLAFWGWQRWPRKKVGQPSTYLSVSFLRQMPSNVISSCLSPSYLATSHISNHPQTKTGCVLFGPSRGGWANGTSFLMDWSLDH